MVTCRPVLLVELPDHEKAIRLLILGGVLDADALCLNKVELLIASSEFSKRVPLDNLGLELFDELLLLLDKAGGSLDLGLQFLHRIAAFIGTKLSYELLTFVNLHRGTRHLIIDYRHLLCECLDEVVFVCAVVTIHVTACLR